MKTTAFFEDIKKKSNIMVIETVDDNIREAFENKYKQFNDKFFYEQFTNCGGIIVDNWVRIYGCGEINVIEKNKRYNGLNTVDILIGEDVLGGLFGLKNGSVFYHAPDTNAWESLDIYYTEFIYWLTNEFNAVNKFYELFRWNSWIEDCKRLKIDEGYSFYPSLYFECNIEERNRKIISIDEIIRINLGI